MSGLASCLTNYVWQIESICQTPCRGVKIGLPKRFTRKNPRMISIRGFFRRKGKEENYLPASLTHRRKNIVFDSSCRSAKIDNRCGGLSEYILKSP